MNSRHYHQDYVTVLKMPLLNVGGTHTIMCHIPNNFETTTMRSRGILIEYSAGIGGYFVRIGLISDTHVPNAVNEVPYQVENAFKGVDLILHAGDIYQSVCLDWLERIAPVTAVELESMVHFKNDSRVEEKRVLTLEGHSIGLVHDLFLRGIDEVRPGSIAASNHSAESLPEIVERFFGDPVTIVVFGHTHIPVMEEHHGILFVNPGSPVLPRQRRELGQVGILEVTPQNKSAWILDLSEFS